jgi:hypothetical protein
MPTTPILHQASNTPYPSIAQHKTLAASHWLSLLIMTLIPLSLDFILGPSYQFSILVVGPVIWAAWRHNFSFAAFLAVLACVLRFACHWAWGFPVYISPAATNTVVRAISLILVALATAQAAWKYQQLKLKIHRLESHLPTCTCCGQIKRHDGEWIPVDTPTPVMDRSKLLCPVCEKLTYR